jgi:hypothetical protein
MESRLKAFFYRSIFFLGWLLSPLTFWNDALINIPFAYLCANLVFSLAGFDFLPMVLVFYWLSNILGIVLMYLSGRAIAREVGYWKEVLLKTILTILVYSIILVLLNNFGILKPVPVTIK